MSAVIIKVFLKLKYALLFILLGFTFTLISQTNSATKQIKLIHADTWGFDKSKNADAQILKGNVVCEHESTIMICDSAYMYDKKQFDAFSNVQIKKGDSLFIYGDSLKYNTNTKIAYIKGKVKCIEKEMTLTADKLTYDSNLNQVLYTNTGTITSKSNVLKSVIGIYNSQSKKIFFHLDVVFKNPSYLIKSDTLIYNTSEKTIHFEGPTIMQNKADYAFSNKGWYNTKTDICKIYNQALIISKQKKLSADTIMYYNKINYAKAINHVKVIDTINHSILTANLVEYWKDHLRIIATNKAVAHYIKNKDTLYITADTLYHNQPDSLHTFIYAYKHVKAFNKSIQAKCDSLIFPIHDSCIIMPNSPLIWVNNGQITAKKIKIYLGKNQIKMIELISNAIVIQKADSLENNWFNQIEGKKMEVFFKNDSIHKIQVNQNAQVIYFPKKENKVIGINHSTSNFMTIYFSQGFAQTVKLKGAPIQTIFPLKDFVFEKFKLPLFIWLDNIRPKYKSEIYSNK